MRVKFHDLSPKDLKFVVIQAIYQGKWIFVRHQDRSTWEIPGGHIELGESADIAAGRELEEETGALDYNMIPICDYSVEREENTYGRLYFGEVFQLGELKHEIEEIILVNELPENLTYGAIQPYLYNKVLDYVLQNR